MTPEETEFLFADHEEEEQIPQEVISDYWDVLIVDDDPEIHSVTKLALSGVTLWNKGIRFHDAFSGKEAIDFLSEPNRICVVLLDVVMETDDAGLHVVKQVRDALGNHLIRIILRTGQPGFAPEENVIREYDINDYKTKTELTRSKLVTSLMTAIRSFEQLRQLEAHSLSLASILDASKAILGHTDIQTFGSAVINQLSKILDVEPRGLMCGMIGEDKRIQVLGGSGEYSPYFGAGIEQLDNGRIILQMQNAFDCLCHQQTEHDVTFVLKTKARSAAIFLELDETKPSLAQMQFAELFLTNVSVGLDNIRLFNKLRDVAYKDTLTKLPNRSNFVESIEKWYAPTNNDYAFIIIDIAQFSDINNGLGQEVGNLLLLAVMDRLNTEFPEAKLLSRIGADVFAFLLPLPTFDESEFLEALMLPFTVGEHVLTVHFHVGICEQQDFHRQGLETLKLAYIALNQAKIGKVAIGRYSADLEEKMAWRLGIIRQLRQDFEQRKLEVWYQPQLNLNTLSVIGCEALLRWPSGQGSYISPAVFVPMAEDSGLIVDIGQWVLEQACQQQRRLAEAGHDISVAVNVSVPQFKVTNYARSVKETIERFDIPTNKIELEVTESVVMDDISGVIDTLSELKGYGVDIAIDDFGTGFSSLSYLQQLPLTRLKIDRAFVKDIPEKDSGAIASLVVSLGKNLGLKTIAEGVETVEQAELLKQLGCDEVQGFLYGKPMKADELLLFLQNKSSQSE